MKVLSILWLFLFSLNLYAQTALKATTINLGLINFQNPFKSIYVPQYEERRQRLDELFGSYLKTQKPDVVFIQELWYADDLSTINTLAQKYGYKPLLNSIASFDKKKGIHGHGLQILVQNNLQIVESGFTTYKDQNGDIVRAGFENLSMFGMKVDIKRGVLHAVIIGEKTNHLNTLVGTTHLTPTIAELKVRQLQLDKLRSFVKNLNVDQVILGVDFNISPVFTGERPSETKGWQQNAKLYDYFLKDLGLSDAFAMVNSAPGYTQDRQHNYIAAMSHSTKEEPEQRIDHIFASSDKLQVQSSRLVFQDKVAGYLLSDHFGVESTLTWR